MKKIVFIGSRVNVFNAALNLGIHLQYIFVLEGSFLEAKLKEEKIAHEVFSADEKKEVLELLYTIDFDILISNGCPIIFPIENFSKSQILINVHPTYLPHLQGKTPLNGVFYDNHTFYGATMHFISSKIDGGNIIFQMKEDLTKDIDLGLLYYLAFWLEGEVFEQGWTILENNNFRYEGISQDAKKDYFNRTPDKMVVDFSSMSNETLLRKIKSFGIKSQGCTAKIAGKVYRIFSADEISNLKIRGIYKNADPGKILLDYDDKLLIKTINGILKIDKYEITTNVSS